MEKDDGNYFIVYLGYRGVILWGNGKENGSYYSMLGLYWDSGK